MRKIRLSVDLDLDNPMDKMIYDYLETPMENGKKRVKSKWFRALAADYLMGNLVNGNGERLITDNQDEVSLNYEEIDDDGMIF